MRRIIDERAPSVNGRRTNLRTFLSDAVRYYAQPPYRLQAPSSIAETSIAPLLQEAQEEIILLSPLLLDFFAHDQGLLLEILRQKVVDGRFRSLLLLTIHQNISTEDPVFALLARRLGEAYLADLWQQRDALIKEVHELQSMSRNSGADVMIYGCREIPVGGLVLTDPTSGPAAMRIVIYSNLARAKPAIPHPFFDVNPRVPEGMIAYNIFHDNYTGLLARSAPIDPQ